MLNFRMLGLLGPILLPFLLVFGSAAPSRAAGCEDKIARHMVGEAILAAQFVAAAEKNGMTASAINATLKDIAANSAIQEFWITDSAGHAYLTNTGIDFTFSADAAKQPQASAFWPLVTGCEKGRDPGGAQARDRQPDFQICRRGGRRQTPHRASRRQRGQFVQVKLCKGSPEAKNGGGERPPPLCKYWRSRSELRRQPHCRAAERAVQV